MSDQRSFEKIKKLIFVILLNVTFMSLFHNTSYAADVVTLTCHEKNGDYRLEGSFNVEADPSVIWDVLTGYERIPRFVGSLKKSHVEEELGPYHFLLEQEFEGGFLFITKRIRVLLDVRETWYETIEFKDTDHKDFELYQGEWQVKPDPIKGEDITYTLEAIPTFSTPFTGDFMNGGAKELLEAVRREIIRYQVEKAKTEKNTPQPTQPTQPLPTITTINDDEPGPND